MPLISTNEDNTDSETNFLSHNDYEQQSSSVLSVPAVASNDNHLQEITVEEATHPVAAITNNASDEILEMDLVNSPPTSNSFLHYNSPVDVTLNVVTRQIEEPAACAKDRNWFVKSSLTSSASILYGAVLPNESFEKSDIAEFRHCRLFLSKYRLVIIGEKPICSIALLDIESVESKDITGLQIWCRDGRMMRITAETREIALIWYKKLTQITCVARNLIDIFAFQFHSGLLKFPKQCAWIRKEAFAIMPSNLSFEKLRREVVRFGLDPHFRVSSINDDFRLCETYPQHLIVPTCLSDEELMSLRLCRAYSRIPTVVWSNKPTGTVLLRSSQPIQGLFGTNNSDLELMKKFRSAIKNEQNKFYFLDLRSYAAAWGNYAKGGGFENSETYAGDVEFMGLANIHNVRSYFHHLRALLNSPCDPNTYLQSLQSTGWLQSIWQIFQAAQFCTKALCYENRSVLVHCTDGWDRTSQIVSLCMLIADPIYRTFDGFEMLVQRQWIEFGHKFADRTSALNGSTDERCPIFLQFLDCVNQLWVKNPQAFEFNQRYLLKLVQHTYSGLFSSFLFNNLKEAALAGCARLDDSKNISTSNLAHLFTDGKMSTLKAFSVWDYLGKHNVEFVNPAYDGYVVSMLTLPKLMYELELWRDAYCCTTAQNFINNPEDKVHHTDASSNLNTATINNNDFTNTMPSSSQEKVLSRSQSATSLTSLEQQGTTALISSINSPNQSQCSVSNSNNLHQKNLPEVTLGQIREHLDVDGLSRIPNIYEEKFVELHQQLLRAQRNIMEASIINPSQFQHHFVNSHLTREQSSIKSSLNGSNEYFGHQSSSLPINWALTSQAFGSPNGYNSYFLNCSKRVRNESVDSTVVGFEFIEEFDSTTMNSICGSANGKRKHDSSGSSSSTTNVEGFTPAFSSQTFSSHSKNRLSRTSLHGNIVDEVNEVNELDDNLFYSTMNGIKNNENNSDNAGVSENDKITFEISEKLCNSNDLINEESVSLTLFSEVSPPSIIKKNSNEIMASVSDIFATKINFQNNFGAKYSDDDLQKDQSVVN